MIVCGQPKRYIQLVNRAHVTVLDVLSGMGRASGLRVKRSNAVSQRPNEVYMDMKKTGYGQCEVAH
jgi:hypothetical protein